MMSINQSLNKYVKKLTHSLHLAILPFSTPFFFRTWVAPATLPRGEQRVCKRSGFFAGNRL